MSVASLIARKLGQPVTPVTRRENTGVTAAALGRESRNPCNPCNPTKTRDTEKKSEWVNPEAVLLKAARQLQVSPASLRAMLTDDDMQDIAEGLNSPTDMLEFFRLAQETGDLLADDTPEPTRQPESHPGNVELMQAWKPDHDELINHLMACSACYAPRARYCTEGAELRRAYLQAYAAHVEKC